MIHSLIGIFSGKLTMLMSDFSRIPKSAIKKGYPERKHKKMAKPMRGNNGRSDH